MKTRTFIAVLTVIATVACVFLLLCIFGVSMAAWDWQNKDQLRRKEK